MAGRMVVVTPDGRETTQEVAGEGDTLLPLLQKTVGGFIQMVPQFSMYQGRKCVVFCDEEGKLKGRPPNNRATELWAQSLGVQPFRLGDHLVGDIAILLGDDEFLASL